MKACKIIIGKTLLSCLKKEKDGYSKSELVLIGLLLLFRVGTGLLSDVAQNVWRETLANRCARHLVYKFGTVVTGSY